MNFTKAPKIPSSTKATEPKPLSVIDNSTQNQSILRKANLTAKATLRAEAPRPNNTGMPDNLKSGIESLSGFSMDEVRVHYNSSKPATVQALAYTQGTDIHVAPGQEKHLPHEAWHVAQQMAGRVSPTTNINGMPVNDNAALEHEADVMGEKAATQKSPFQLKKDKVTATSSHKIIQCEFDTQIDSNKLNVVGEDHVESEPRRKREIEIANNAGLDYKQESMFYIKDQQKNITEVGDDHYLRCIHALIFFRKALYNLRSYYNLPGNDANKKYVNELLNCNKHITVAITYLKKQDFLDKTFERNFASTQTDKTNFLNNINEGIQKIVNNLFLFEERNNLDVESFQDLYVKTVTDLALLCINLGALDPNDYFKISNTTTATNVYEPEICLERSLHMHNFATQHYSQHVLWKIGDAHCKDINSKKIPRNYNLISREIFNNTYFPKKRHHFFSFVYKNVF